MRDFPLSAPLSLKPRHEGRDDAASCDSGHLHVNDPHSSARFPFRGTTAYYFLNP